MLDLAGKAVAEMTNRGIDLVMLRLKGRSKATHRRPGQYCEEGLKSRRPHGHGVIGLKDAIADERSSIQTSVNRTRPAQDLVETRSRFMAAGEASDVVCPAPCCLAADGFASAR